MRAETIYCGILLALEVLLAFQLPGAPVAGPAIGVFVILFLGNLAVNRDTALKLRYIYAFFLFLVAAAANKGSFEHVTLAVVVGIHYFTLTEGFTGSRRYAVKKGEPLPPDGRPGIYSLAFCGSIALSYLFLDGKDLPFPLFVRGLLAFISVLCGFCLWDIGYITRLQRATRFRRPTVPTPVRIVKGLVLAAVLVTLFLLFGRAIPATADALHGTASSFRKGAGSLGNSGLSADRDRVPDFEDPETSGSRQFQPHKLPTEGNFRTDPSLLLAIDVPDSGSRDALANSRIYVRGYALDTFDNDEWLTPPDDKSEVLIDSSDGTKDGRVEVRALDQALRPAILQHIRMLEPFQRTLPAVQGATAYHLDLIGRKPGDWHIAVNRAPEVYTAESVPSIYDAVKNAGLSVPSAIDAQYLEFPKTQLSRDMQQLVTGLRGRPLTERIDGVLELLDRRCRYSTSLTNPGRFSALQNFLFGEKQGICIHYATAAALLLRMAEVPTRVAFGLSGGEYYEDEQVFAFRGHDAHAWVEVLLEGHGWTAVEPTPENAGAAHRPKRAKAPDDYFDKIAGSQADSPPLAQEAGASVSRWLRKLRDLPWGAITGVMLGSIFLTALLISWKQRKRNDAEDTSILKFNALDAEDPKYLRDLYRMCARQFGVQKRRSETLLEFVNQLKLAGAFNSEFDSLCDYHYGVYYCGGTRVKEREAQLREAVKDFHKR